MQLSEQYCKARHCLLKDTAPQLRKDYLYSQLLAAEKKNDKEKTRRVQAKLQHETSKKTWYFINRLQKDP